MNISNLIKKALPLYIPIFCLLTIAVLEFILILRHKSPYMSDSYFYQHIYYQMQGDSYDQARSKILKKLDAQKLTDLEKNFYYRPDKYKYVLSRYVRRPFYPYAAVLINLLVHNEYLAFLLPVFISYLGCFVCMYFLFRFRFDRFWASFGTALFLGFYPFLDWSTYFLTDTIGAFFWLLQISLVMIYIKTQQKLFLIYYIAAMIISLFNREQSVLMFVTILVVFVGERYILRSGNKSSVAKKLLVVSLITTGGFLVVNSVFKYPSLYDSWIYLQSNFGYKQLEYTKAETARFLLRELVRLHVGLIEEMIRHRWWFLISFLGGVGALQIFFVKRKAETIDWLMLGSSFASYLGLIIVPYLTYRYFFPTIIGVIYFGMFFLKKFFYGEKMSHEKR